MTPIREVGQTVIGAGERAPITTEIQNVLFAAVRGRDALPRVVESNCATCCPSVVAAAALVIGTAAAFVYFNL